jgi:hypothetical protein
MDLRHMAFAATTFLSLSSLQSRAEPAVPRKVKISMTSLGDWAGPRHVLR